MPQETKSHTNDPAVAATNAAAPSLFGLVADRADEAALLEALEKAFDYRGDVTLTLASGARVEGYIFDRSTGRTLADSLLRLMGPASDEKITVAYDEIDRVEFTGKDAAHGKSFETWVRKYVEKKMKGERASIESEGLD